MPVLTPESMDVLGFEKRHWRLDVTEGLSIANFIPYGGGYNLPDVMTVKKVTKVECKRYFDVRIQSDRGKNLIPEVRESPFEYQVRTVVLHALDVRLLNTVAKLIPGYVWKVLLDRRSCPASLHPTT